MQDGRLVRVRQRRVLADLRDLLLARLVVDLVREVGREDERLVPRDLHREGERQFAALDADVHAALVDVLQDVVRHGLAVLQLHEPLVRVVLDVAVPRALEALQAAHEPGAARFEEAVLRVRVALQHAVEHDAGEVHHLAERVAERVHRSVRAHVVQPHVVVHAAVDADGAAEAVRLLVDRPVLRVAQVVLQLERARAGEHRAGETEFLDDAPQFDGGLRGLLQRDEAHRLEARVLADVLVVHPVVVRPREFDRPVAAHDAPESEAVGRVEHRLVDAHVVQEVDPALAPDARERAFRQEVAVGRVQVVVGREGAARRHETAVPVIFRHARPDGVVVLDQVAVAVDDPLDVFSDHGSYLLGVCLRSCLSSPPAGRSGPRCGTSPLPCRRRTCPRSRAVRPAPPCRCWRPPRAGSRTRTGTACCR